MAVLSKLFTAVLSPGPDQDKTDNECLTPGQDQFRTITHDLTLGQDQYRTGNHILTPQDKTSTRLELKYGPQDGNCTGLT